MARRSQEHTAALGGGDTTKVDVPILTTRPTADELAQAVRALNIPARFEVTGLLGQGGMGYVFEARDKRLGREVALKVLARTKLPPTARARFEREARAVAKLQHPAIVGVFELSDDGELMVMELIRGETLHARLRRGKLAVEEVRALGDALCRALAVAHAAEVTHRDVKPSNVLYEKATGRILLADFGIAMIERDAELTDTGTVVGTPAYMAPEQLRGANVGPRSDLYAVGATLFEAATGARLNTEAGPVSDPEQAVARITGDIGLARAIARAVSFDPKERHASADEMRIALATRTTMGAFPPVIRAVTAPPDVPAPRLSQLDTAVQPEADTQVRPGTEPSDHGPIAVASPTNASPPPSASVGARMMTLPPSEPVRRIAWGRVIGVLAVVVAIAVVIVWRTRGGASSETAAVRDAAVLALPFEARTSDPAVVYEAHSLAHGFDRELERLTMIARIPHETVSGNDPATWLGQAHRTQATHIVRGVIEERAGTLYLVVDVLRGDVTRRVLDVPTKSGAVLSTLIAGVPAIAGALVEPHEVASHFARGRVALIEDRVPDAVRHFATVALYEPTNTEAAAEAAIATWWNSGTPDPTRIALDKALAMPQPPAWRELLVAYRKLVDYEPTALATFVDLEKRRGDEFHVVYGLFEAQYHLGHGADSMATYNRLRKLAPNVVIGQLHALSYVLAHPDAPGLEWAVGLVAKDPRTRTLRARQLIFERDWAAAAKLATATRDREAEFELVQIHLALHDQRYDDALAGARKLESPVAALAYELAISNARGDLEAIDAALVADRLTVLDNVIDKAGSNEVAELAAVAAGLGRSSLVERVQKALDRQALWAKRSATSGIARALLGETTPSEIPQVLEVQRALAAERDRNWDAAAAAWQRAGELALDGRTLDLMRFGVARARYRGGNYQEAARTCADVIEPRYFQAQWGVAVVDCLTWQVDEAMRRGDRDAATTAARYLVKLRPITDVATLLQPR